jgi:hypothetical protein
MVYPKANLWNLNMYTAAVFGKRARLLMLEKYFNEK